LLIGASGNLGAVHVFKPVNFTLTHGADMGS
jgi:hypothetical protein